VALQGDFMSQPGELCRPVSYGTRRSPYRAILVSSADARQRFTVRSDELLMFICMDHQTSESYYLTCNGQIIKAMDGWFVPAC
jgi:hypothetical protein